LTGALLPGIRSIGDVQPAPDLIDSHDVDAAEEGGRAIAPITPTGLFDGPGGTSGARPRLEGVAWGGDASTLDHGSALRTSSISATAHATRPCFNADVIGRLPW